VITQKKDPGKRILDIVKRDQDFAIFEDNQPFLTTGGNEFCHRNERFLKHILSDLQIMSNLPPEQIRPSVIFGFQVDLEENGKDFIVEQFSAISNRDIFIRMKTGSSRLMSNITGMTDCHDPVAESDILQFIFYSLSSVLQCLNTFIEEHISRMETPDELVHPLILLLKQQYLGASSEKKAAIQLLSFRHDSGLVLPLLFVSGKLSASEYASGVQALGLRRSFPENQDHGSDPGFPIAKIIRDKDLLPLDRSFIEIFRDASVIADYLSFFEFSSTNVRQTPGLLSGGENSTIEYKSTFRWDLKAGKTNPAVERASLKTICAFLNTSGGTLLIGVRDDTTIEGIESDRFANDDKFLLHLWTLIRTSLGRDVSPYIQTHLEKIEDKTVCIVSVSTSRRPVFLRQPGFGEEFYIRLGPSSASLDISEALKYIADRFRQS